jgi:hypothetical protein
MSENIYEKVLKEFNRKKINYAILRNYNNFENNEDLDFLVSKKDGVRVKSILKKFHLLKRVFGFYLISDKRFDIKPGCMEYGKLVLEDAEEILKRKRKVDYFFVLGKEDELIHLILKSLGNGFSNEKYTNKIKELIQECDLEKVKGFFFKYLGDVGLNLFENIIKENYFIVKKLKGEVYNSLNSLRRKIKYLFCRISFPCLKR